MSGRSVLECEPFIQRFRTADEKQLELGLLLADDPLAQRIALAWTKIRVGWERPEGEPPGALEDLWEWLWDGCLADEKELRAAARVGAFAFGSRFTSLVACRAIYPDGTLSTGATAVLRAELWKRYPASRRKPEKEG